MALTPLSQTLKHLTDHLMHYQFPYSNNLFQIQIHAQNISRSKNVENFKFKFKLISNQRETTFVCDHKGG